VLAFLATVVGHVSTAPGDDEYPVYVELSSDIRRLVRLDGVWQFRLDPRDDGVREGWFAQDRTLPDKITVPGAWQAQGFGERTTVPIAERKIGSEVGPQTQYLGTAWYKRKIVVPRVWPRQRVWLKLAGVNPSADVWVNGILSGQTKQPGIPVRFDITGVARPGENNDITVRIHEHNRGLGNWYNLVAWWSGLWRSTAIEITREAWLHDVRVLPDVDRSVAVARVELRGDVLQNSVVRAVIAPAGGRASRKVDGAGVFTLEIPIEKARLWSPDDPHLYTARVSLEAAGENVDQAAARFGMRKIEARADRLYLNNQPVYLRGYGDDGMYPHSLHPETEPQALRKQLALIKSFGFNLAYPCVFMPPDEFLDAADEIGMLVRFDAPAVLAFQRRGPGGLPEDSAEEQRVVREQWHAALRWTQNHPSVVIYGPGSEIHPDNRHVAELYRMAKEEDPSRLVMSWSGAKGMTDLADVGTLEEPVDASEELQAIMNGPRWRDPRGVPGLIHEYCGSEALPDPANILRYRRGLSPAPEIEVRDAVRALGLADLIPELVANSQKIAALCRRLEIEEARKIPYVVGYNMWLIQDIPGYPQGIFDPFWKPKSLEAAEFARSNGETVLVMNEATRRTRRAFQSGEQARFEVFVSHHGARPLAGGVLRWSIARSGGPPLASGKLAAPEIAPFTTTAKLFDLEVPVPRVTNPTRARFGLVLDCPARRVENEWDIWLFPPVNPAQFRAAVYGASGLRKAFPHLTEWTGPTDVLFAGRLDNRVIAYLEGGGRVLLVVDDEEEQLRSDALVRTQFMPRWPLTGGQDISATFIERHPAIGEFPHDGFCAYQFYNLIVHPAGSLPLPPEGILAKRPAFNRGLGVAFNLDRLPRRVSPIVRVFGKNENRAYMFEARVGKGRLLATTLRLAQTAPQFPEAAWLAAQLLAYAGGSSFEPAVTLASADLDPWRQR
jgi:beta-galactosidase